MSIDFNDSVLYLSLRSPFARRIRLAFEENGVRYREEVRDVWTQQPDLIPLNPLHRVPTLQLKSGEVLTESSLILDLFYRQQERKLSYRDTTESLLGYHWSGLAVGWIEKTIERFLETLRPEKERDPDFMNELPVMSERVLKRLDSEIGSRATLIPNRLTQADLDLGSALGYLMFRYEKNVLASYPNVRRYFEGLDARASFSRTRPVG